MVYHVVLRHLSRKNKAELAKMMRTMCDAYLVHTDTGTVDIWSSITQIAAEMANYQRRWGIVVEREELK